VTGLIFKEYVVSEKDPIRIFVAHLFTEHMDYLRIFEYLESRDNFFYINYADPGRMPPAGGTEAIKEELRNQIKQAEVLLLPVTLFEENQDLITFQMDVAQAFGKPIIAIKSFGGTVVIQKVIVDRADEIVEWSDRAITDAIRRQARHEDTTQWETIEFKLD
jgi:hypothetical protein